MNVERRGYERSKWDYATTQVTNVAVLLIVAMMLFVTGTIAWPYEAFEKMSIKVTNTPVAGGQYTVRMDYCKHRELTPKRVIVTLQDSITIVLYSQQHPLKIGCHVVDITDTMPAKVPAGVYSLEMLVVYEPWPWRTFTQTYHTPPFTVEAAAR